MMITAELTTIRTSSIAIQHPVDPDKYASLESHYESVEARWPYAPVLVVESDGNGATVLDGHHRIHLAKSWGLSEIPAYVISIPDYCALLDAHFDGSTPNRLPDLDDHILVDGKVHER